MQISEKRKSALYEAISEPIMKTRIRLAQSDIDPDEHFDNALFQMNFEIWREVKQVLGIED